MIDPHVILAMSFNFILRSSHFILPKYPVFIMAMPLNMILVVCHTMYIVIYDFNKLTFLYIHVHISLLLL